MEQVAADGLPPVGAQTRLLVVAPHPDDETIATGILIQQVVAAGGVVRVLLLTAGDNNPWPQRWVERRWRIGPHERKRWGCRRHVEILRAIEHLGLGADDLQCLAWPDMGLTNCLMNPAYGAVDTLQGAIDAFAPSLIAMPSLEDSHPDHGAAHVMIRLAVAKSDCRPQLLAYLVHGRTHDASYVALSGTSAQQTNKQAALQKHGSQMVLSGHRLRRLIAAPERYLDVQATSLRSACVLPWQPVAWLRSRLRLSLASAGMAESWRWPEAPVNQTPDGSFQLDADVAAATSPLFVKLTWNVSSFWIFDYWGWHEL
jgi:N-acetyl-1-D-myo-inositol-2-amino-2-deoxy-alpha-D-glucopyranoside deacetylase